MENNTPPLVSIIIITYNSSAYVCETLDSVISQTYQNIEIIVSDDYSSDNTVQVCCQWIEEHKNSSIRVEIITTDHNTGTSGNCNRGVKAAKGEWIKVIAGDDVLFHTAIADYMEYVSMHKEVRHLIANKVLFSGNFENKHFQDCPTNSFLFRDNFSAKQQYSVIKKMFFGSGPTYFIRKDALFEVGGFDERFPLQEDYPLYIKMIGKGYKMELLEKPTVYYRVSEMSVSHSKDKNAIFTTNQVRIITQYKYKYREEVLNRFWKILHYYSIEIQTLILKMGNSKKFPQCYMLKILYSITDPFVLFARYIKLREKIFDRFAF